MKNNVKHSNQHDSRPLINVSAFSSHALLSSLKILCVCVCVHATVRKLEKTGGFAPAVRIS